MEVTGFVQYNELQPISHVLSSSICSLLVGGCSSCESNGILSLRETMKNVCIHNYFSVNHVDL